MPRPKRMKSAPDYQPNYRTGERAWPHYDERRSCDVRPAPCYCRETCGRQWRRVACIDIKTAVFSVTKGRLSTSIFSVTAVGRKQDYHHWHLVP
jgi:hypothetical protein